MRARRLMVALLSSLVVSILFTVWLSRRVAKPIAVSAPPKQWVVAGKEGLEAGQLVKPESLHLIEWPVVPANSARKIEDVAGRILLSPVPKDQPILTSYLAPPGVGSGLTARIPSGMRATSVRSDEVVGVAGFLLPGTHVDVLLTYHSAKSGEPRTATVLQDVVVIAAGQQFRPDPEGRPTSVNVVTLLLTPADSEKLVLATSSGAIHFVLRNGADKDMGSSPSLGLDELTGVDPSAANPHPIDPQAENARRYQVETILGDKQVVKSFF